MQVIFWIEDNFCFISDCWKSFNCILEKVLNDQIIISIVYQKYFVHLTSPYRKKRFKHFKHSKQFILFHPIQVTGSAYCGIVFQTMYIHLKDMYITLKKIGKILFASVLRILLICKFRNFTVAFGKKSWIFWSLHAIFSARKLISV